MKPTLGRSDVTTVRRFQDRALQLLGQALQRTAPDQRAAFWRDVIQTDQALRIIRRLPGSLWGDVVRSGRAVRVDDADADGRFDGRPLGVPDAADLLSGRRYEPGVFEDRHRRRRLVRSRRRRG